MEEADRHPSRKPDYMRAGIGIADAKERRRLESTLATQNRREGQLRAKRLKREQVNSSASLLAAVDEATLAADLRTLKEKLTAPLSSAGRLQVLEQLRHLITVAGDASSASDACYEKAGRILDAISECGLVPILKADLFPRQDTEENRAACFQACWALSSLAAAEHRIAQKVVDAAPVLITHLSGGFGTAIAEQSAWTLGNLAGDCTEVRARLLANGALQPLTRLMLAARARSEGAGTVAAARTAAWALCNLIKDAGPEVEQMVSLESFKPSLRELLGRSDAPALVTEVAWLTAYATASSQKHLEPGDILQPLLALLPTAVHQLQQQAEGPAPALLTPVLRSIGNLVAAGAPADLLPAFSSDEAHLQCLLTCSQARHQGIQKEALWVLSNFAALQTSDRSATVLLKGVGGDHIMARLLQEGTFPVRKEAAFGVANMCRNDQSLMAAMVGTSMEDVPARVLPAFASLARSPDPEASLLAIHFFEAVLRLLPQQGQQMVESVDGIDILEQQQMRGTPESQVLATELLDTYFGEEFGL